MQPEAHAAKYRTRRHTGHVYVYYTYDKYFILVKSASRNEKYVHVFCQI